MRRGSRETKPGKYKVGVKGNPSRTRTEESFIPLLFLDLSSAFIILQTLVKIAKKIIKEKFMAALYPEDFQGAASSGDDIIIISSDEDELMDTLSLTSVFDLQLSSEGEEQDEKIKLMAKCVEMEMSAPIPMTEPSYAKRAKEEVVPLGY